MIELTEIAHLRKDEVEKSISKSWPQEPHYRGKEVFGHIYGFSRADGQGIEGAVTALDLLPQDYQECYLGYLPSEDAFILGFDAWEDECDCCYDFHCGASSGGVHFGVFKVKMHADMSFGVAKPIPKYGCQMFYSDHVYKQLRADHPDLIDMRLD